MVPSSEDSREHSGERGKQGNAGQNMRSALGLINPFRRNMATGLSNSGDSCSLYRISGHFVGGRLYFLITLTALGVLCLYISGVTLGLPCSCIAHTA